MDISLVDALVRKQCQNKLYKLYEPCVYRFAQAIAPTGGFRARKFCDELVVR